MFLYRDLNFFATNDNGVLHQRYCSGRIQMDFGRVRINRSYGDGGSVRDCIRIRNDFRWERTDNRIQL